MTAFSQILATVIEVNVARLPKSDKTPQADQMIKDIPMLPEFFRIPLGEMKIPAPMMVPMMMEIPRRRVTFFFNTTLSEGVEGLQGSGESLPLLAFFLGSTSLMGIFLTENDFLGMLMHV